MDSDRCESIATVRRFWPGNDPDLVCIGHAMDSQRIANAMGFTLVIEPVGNRVGEMPDEFPI